jgi:hypothetical protein
VSYILDALPRSPMLLLFIYLDFDVCASCYNTKGPSVIGIEHHKMEHPVVKWTLSPRDGQRQWIHCEANSVLEVLRSDGHVGSKEQVGDRVGDSDSGEDEDDDDYNSVKEGEGKRAIAAWAAIAAELRLDADKTDNKAGAVSPFPYDDTMKHMNQDAEETESSKQAKDEGEEDEDEDEGGNEEEGGVIAAGATVATELGLDVDETDSKAGEMPPFPDDETMGNHNQKAEETETGDQAKDEDNSVDSGEEIIQVAQDPVAPQRSYTCGRCSDDIDLDSTFYRCVGHSCRGTFARQSWIFLIYLFHVFSLRFFYLRTMRVYSE